MDSWLEYTPLAGLASLTWTDLWTLLPNSDWAMAVEMLPTVRTTGWFTSTYSPHIQNWPEIFKEEKPFGYSISNKREKYNSLQPPLTWRDTNLPPSLTAVLKSRTETGNCVQFILINLSAEIF